MKVLQINAVNGIASTGRTCLEESEWLVQNGDEAVTLFAGGIGTLGIGIAPKWEMKLHGLFSRLFGLQGYFSPVATGRILREIRRFSPDVVHLRNLHGNYVHLNRLLRYLAKRDIPTVVTLHDCWFFTGKCTHYVGVGCDRWQTGCGNCPQLKTDNVSWFFDRTAKMWRDKKKRFDAIPRLAVTGVSDWITGEGAKAPLFENAKIIRRVYNWVDTDVFRPVDAADVKRSLGIEGHKMVLGVASGWSNKKGLDKFIRLAGLLDEDVRIVLVGNMGEMPLPQGILHIPATDSVEELVKLYSAADVFLQLSEAETFGKVAAEALACGTPVITNNKTANPELVTADCGMVLSELSDAAIAEAVLAVLQKGKEAFREACVARAETAFSKTVCIKAYREVYEDLTAIGR